MSQPKYLCSNCLVENDRSIAQCIECSISNPYYTGKTVNIVIDANQIDNNLENNNIPKVVEKKVVKKDYTYRTNLRLYEKLYNKLQDIKTAICCLVFGGILLLTIGIVFWVEANRVDGIVMTIFGVISFFLIVYLVYKCWKQNEMIDNVEETLHTQNYAAWKKDWEKMHRPGCGETMMKFCPDED